MAPRRLKPLHRRKTYEQWQGICGICNCLVRASDVTIDHITPLSRGGTDALSNRQPAHHRCNEWKADRTMREIIGAACSLETGAELQTILVQLYREDYEAMMRFYPDSTPEMAAWRCIRARVSGSQQPGDSDT